MSIPLQERRRLKERYPSLALAASDAEACRATLSNYETLALAREVCEGKCAMGRPCPTGLCRQPSKRLELWAKFPIGIEFEPVQNLFLNQFEKRFLILFDANRLKTIQSESI